MAASNFDAAVARVLRHEGGYADHPRDPGGPTNFGITLATYRRFVDRDATAADIRVMPLTVARDIYRARYWDALCCDALPAGVDYAVFDYAVNSGTGRAGRVLRRLLGLPATSHAATAEVIAAAGARDAAALVSAICDERLAFLRRLGTWDTFGRGWERRVAEVRRHGLAMARDPRDAIAQGGERAKARGLAGIAASLMAAFGVAAAWITDSVGDPLALAALAIAAASLAVATALLWRRHARERRRIDEPSAASAPLPPSVSSHPQGD